MSTALFWFRQDLRIEDNPALSMACGAHDHLIPLYIKESKPTQPMGAAQHWWLHHSLNALKKSLIAVGLDLCLKQSTDILTLLKHIIQEHQIDAVYWNRCYEPVHSARDTLIKAALKSSGIKVITCNGSLLHEPWEVLNQSGNYFKVFTPYWRQCLRQMSPRPLFHIAAWPSNRLIDSDTLNEWNLLPKNPNWADEFPKHWQPGEAGAALKLNAFLSQNIKGYKDRRNEPALSATSQLSPHLHFGEISPQQIWHAVQEEKLDPSCDLLSSDTFLSELGWREFSYQLLFHMPQLPKANFKNQFDAFPWKHNPAHLKQWQRGMTGYPIVDAGMRELWRTGYMHNRVRMIVASFLTKHLLIDWREGAAWFWDTLLDADLASNAASWQWVAGSGADAAPYYRIFNPVLQGEKFDPQGEYVRRWVPELNTVPNKWIHHPWDAPSNSLAIILGLHYPKPLVDHTMAREEALLSYKGLRG